jgi:uncharacterized BrkB/YihY/UPF0761 family membrane protein
VVADLPAADPPDEAKPGFAQRLRNRLDRWRAWAADRLELEQGRRPSVRVALDFYQRDQAFAGSLLAGGLSVKLFLWFLPFALSVVALIGTLADRFDQPADDLARASGLTAVLADLVADAVEESTRARWYLVLIGIVLLLWTGLGVVRALALTSRLAWRLPGIPAINRLAGSVGVLGFVVAILALQWARSRLLGGPWWVDLLVLVTTMAVLVGLLLLLFIGRRIPRRFPGRP